MAAHNIKWKALNLVVMSNNLRQQQPKNLIDYRKSHNTWMEFARINKKAFKAYKI
jgi:lipocalin